MLPWHQRPPEVANLFNPAFCALALHNAIAGFEEKVSQGMAYELAFLLLPLVLHRATREALPTRTSSKLHVWIQAHEQVRVGLVKRVAAMVPTTKEGLLFAMQRQILQVNDDGLLVTSIVQQKSSFEPPGPSDTQECLERAAFLGRWFGVSGNSSSVLAAWGVQFA
jgi:Family of unknown function (DUF6521)